MHVRHRRTSAIRRHRWPRTATNAPVWDPGSRRLAEAQMVATLVDEALKARGER
jgi:hypothetical protein